MTFGSHFAKSESQTGFDSRTLTLPPNPSTFRPHGEEIYPPLDGATFDRTSHPGWRHRGLRPGA